VGEVGFRENEGGVHKRSIESGSYS
jgi:hypothetical protein